MQKRAAWSAHFFELQISSPLGSVLPKSPQKFRCGVSTCHHSLLRIPMMRQLLDVMHQAEELPLAVDLLLSAQREAVEPLVPPGDFLRSLCRRLPNTGSTVANLRPYSARPRSESIARFIRSV